MTRSFAKLAATSTFTVAVLRVNQPYNDVLQSLTHGFLCSAHRFVSAIIVCSHVAQHKFRDVVECSATCETTKTHTDTNVQQNVLMSMT